MNRIPRTLAALALSFSLLAAAVPAAHARTLTKPQSSIPAIGSWLDATLAWVIDHVAGVPKAPAAQSSQKLEVNTTGGYAVPMTGSCIDPWGNSRPCPGGGI
jgi:hypothetical protein